MSLKNQFASPIVLRNYIMNSSYPGQSQKSIASCTGITITGEIYQFSSTSRSTLKLQASPMTTNDTALAETVVGATTCKAQLF